MRRTVREARQGRPSRGLSGRTVTGAVDVEARRCGSPAIRSPAASGNRPQAASATIRPRRASLLARRRDAASKATSAACAPSGCLPPGCPPPGCPPPGCPLPGCLPPGCPLPGCPLPGCPPPARSRRHPPATRRSAASAMRRSVSISVPQRGQAASSSMRRRQVGQRRSRSPEGLMRRPPGRRAGPRSRW